MMKKLFIPLVVVAAAMFAYAPVAINKVPLESTMLLVQKIFYFHFATWMAVTAGSPENVDSLGSASSSTAKYSARTGARSASQSNDWPRKPWATSILAVGWS